MADRPDAHTGSAADEPNPKLLELSEHLVGRWRVDGPDISGQAEYESRNGGRLLVAYVDFRVGDSRMRVIQPITHHEDRGSLIARYMDTMGGEATSPKAVKSARSIALTAVLTRSISEVTCRVRRRCWGRGAPMPQGRARRRASLNAQHLGGPFALLAARPIATRWLGSSRSRSRPSSPEVHLAALAPELAHFVAVLVVHGAQSPVMLVETLQSRSGAVAPTAPAGGLC